MPHLEARWSLRGGFLSRTPSALLCPVSLLFHLSLLLWLQGDSPGPVQKNLHSPIVQVGVPAPGSWALPSPQPAHAVSLVPLGPWHPPFHPGAPKAESR